MSPLVTKLMLSVASLALAATVLAATFFIVMDRWWTFSLFGGHTDPTADILFAAVPTTSVSLTMLFSWLVIWRKDIRWTRRRVLLTSVTMAMCLTVPGAIASAVTLCDMPSWSESALWLLLILFLATIPLQLLAIGRRRPEETPAWVHW